MLKTSFRKKSKLNKQILVRLNEKELDFCESVMKVSAKATVQDCIRDLIRTGMLGKVKTEVQSNLTWLTEH